MHRNSASLFRFATGHGGVFDRIAGRIENRQGLSAIEMEGQRAETPFAPSLLGPCKQHAFAVAAGEWDFQIGAAVALVCSDGAANRPAALYRQTDLCRKRRRCLCLVDRWSGNRLLQAALPEPEQR